MLRRHLKKMLPEFEALPGVVGLTLSGGLSRGYADRLSKIKAIVTRVVRGRGEYVSSSSYWGETGGGVSYSEFTAL